MPLLCTISHDHMKAMKTRLATFTTVTTLVFACAIPLGAAACEWHGSTGLQNSFGEFHLPNTGDKASQVTETYGEPSRRLQGGKDTAIWDYGSFRVIFKNDTVTFAGMW